MNDNVMRQHLFTFATSYLWITDSIPATQSIVRLLLSINHSGSSQPRDVLTDAHSTPIHNLLSTFNYHELHKTAQIILQKESMWWKNCLARSYRRALTQIDCHAAGDDNSVCKLQKTIMMIYEFFCVNRTGYMRIGLCQQQQHHPCSLNAKHVSQQKSSRACSDFLNSSDIWYTVGKFSGSNLNAWGCFSQGAGAYTKLTVKSKSM